MFLMEKLHRRKSLQKCLCLSALSLLAAVLGLTFQPGLLGLWESFTFVHTFAPFDAPLSFRIAQRANIGGQGYALLEINQYLAKYFHMNLLTFRLPVIVYGWVSLFLYFVITRRIFGFPAAAASTAMLSVSAAFLVYQHQVIVSIVTFMAVLLMIERVQAFARSPGILTAGTLGLAMTLCSLHYGPGRHLMLALAGYSFLLRCISLHNGQTSWLGALRKAMPLSAVCGAAWIISLALLDRHNLRDLADFRGFLLPKGSDMPMEPLALLAAIPANAGVVLAGFLPWSSAHYSSMPVDLLMDGRLRLLPVILTPLFWYGLAIAIRQWRCKKYWLLYFLLAVTLGPPLLSMHVSVGSTISTHRLFYALIPCIWCLSIGIRAVAIWVRRRAAVYLKLPFAAPLLAPAAVTAIVVVQVVTAYASLAKLDSALVVQENGTAVAVQAQKLVAFRGQENWTPAMRSRYYVEQASYHMLAQKIKKQLDRHDAAETLLILIDPSEYPAEFPEPKFPPAHPPHTSLGYFAHLNHRSVFVWLYLSQMGVDAAFTELLPESQKRTVLPGSGYRGKPRLFPASFDHEKSMYVVDPLDRLTTVIRYNRHAPRVIVTTSPEEFQQTELRLSAEKIEYRPRRL